MTIHWSANALCDDMRFAMSFCLIHKPTVRDFNVPFFRLEHYLNDNLVVERDENGASVLTSKHAAYANIALKWNCTSTVQRYMN